MSASTEDVFFFWHEYFYINIQNGMALCNGIIILRFLSYMLKYV